ncbi:MAG: hypothetical protein UCJ13_03825, partial [Bacteroidaceae bacterium]|nr:hypothetical protein [Bacteroidaceae bacterium]
TLFYRRKSSAEAAEPFFSPKKPSAESAARFFATGSPRQGLPSYFLTPKSPRQGLPGIFSPQKVLGRVCRTIFTGKFSIFGKNPLNLCRESKMNVIL